MKAKHALSLKLLTKSFQNLCGIFNMHVMDSSADKILSEHRAC